jgi:hypothetical protein
MSDETLSPQDAMAFAEAVYGIRQTPSVRAGFAMSLPNHCLGTDWDLGAAQSIQGVSGPVVPTPSGFAAVVPGSGRRGSEIVVATRGSVGAFNGPDWTSNFRAAYAVGPAGTQVHKGFHEIFKTLIGAVREQMRRLGARNRRTIHCVGHSLGGALANLMAVALQEETRADVKLYTFGAPRVGDMFFSRAATKNLAAGNIHRVYNVSDPVPMIPLFPYMHAAFDEDGIRVGSPTLRIFSGNHLIQPGYVQTTPPGASWLQLRAGSPEHRRPFSFADWLDDMEGTPIIPFSSSVLSAIGRALDAVRTVFLDLCGIGLQGVVTLADQIAMLMIRAVEISREISQQVLRLIRLVLRWAGRKVIESAAELTRAFLNYVLELVLRPIAAMADRALAQL